MSYILDALKKSEEARRRQQVPDASALITEMESQSGRTARSGRRSNWILFALLLNALLLGAWLWQGRTDQAAQVPEPIVRAAPAANPDSARDTASVRSPAPVAHQPAEMPLSEMPLSEMPLPETPPPEMPLPEMPLPETPLPEMPLSDPVAAAPIQAVPIDALDTELQRRIPALTFSTHIYTDEAAYREVGINGARYREGDRVEEVLVLEAITASGVILRLDETRFSVSVLRDWSW